MALLLSAIDKYFFFASVQRFLMGSWSNKLIEAFPIMCTRTQRKP